MKRIVLYALGEIFLVVIGILIAVQLNNWNNQRKLAIVESITLDRLLEDLRNDLHRFHFLDSSLDNRINRCDTIINLIYNQSSRDDRLQIIRKEAVEIFLLEPNTITYDEMLNTGRLYSLSNDSLRAEIVYYYRQLKKWGAYAELNNDRIRRISGQPELYDYWVLQSKARRDAPIDFNKYPWINQKYSEEMKDIEHLVFQTRINQSANWRTFRFLRRLCEELIQTLEENQ